MQKFVVVIKLLSLKQQTTAIETIFNDKQYRCVVESTVDGVSNICYTYACTGLLLMITVVFYGNARIRYSPVTKYWSYKTYVQVLKKGRGVVLPIFF